MMPRPQRGLTAIGASHNQCCIVCFAVTKSSALLSNSEMRAEWEAKEAEALRVLRPRYMRTLEELESALNTDLPDTFQTDWVHITPEMAEALITGAVEQDQQRDEDTLEQREQRGDEDGEV